MGRKDAYDWNKAAIGKYIWAIASKKDTLFVKWIHSVYLQGKDWWDYELPRDSSWIWRQLVHLKNLFKEKVGRQQFIQEDYNIKKGHRLLFEQEQPVKVQWATIVWDRLSIPKHRVIFWLVMLEKLKTREKLGKLGLVTDCACLFCAEEQEVLSHLFFDCRYSKECLAGSKDWLGLNFKATKLERILRWIRRRLNRFRRRVVYAVISALVWCIMFGK